MALETLNDLTNTSALIDILPDNVVSKVESLILISKIALILFIVYLAYLLISRIFTFRRNRRIDKMYHKINEMDRKLDNLLGKRHKEIDEDKIEEKKSDKIKEEGKSKKGFFSRLVGKKDKKKTEKKVEKKVEKKK